MSALNIDAETIAAAIDDLSQVSPVGERLFGQLVRAGVSTDSAYDIRLVVTELATNALEHGKAEQVAVSLTIDAASVCVTMTHVDRGVAPDPNEAVMPSPISQRGRGLALVAALSSSVNRAVLDGATVTTVSVAR